MYSEHSAAIAAPPQRRRRPALACLQCRQRKVKCDQNKPCNQCQRSKDAICTYSSDLNPSQLNSNLQGHGTPQSFNQLAYSQPRQRLELESVFRLPTPESSTASASTAHSPHYTAASGLAESERSESNGITSKYPANEHLGTVIDDLYTQTAPASLYTPNIERHVANRECMPDLSLRQYPLKTKLFGENHWINYFTQFEKIAGFMFENERTNASNNPSKLYLHLQQCKLLGRAIKSQRPLNCLAVSDYKSAIPTKEVCDELVTNYFRNFESVYRIIHIPSFYASYADYWVNLDENNCCPSMVLVLAIGTVFIPDSAKATSLRATARQWIYAAQQWLSAPLEKSRMNIRGLQIQCLLILARETIGIGSDLIWTSIGTLIRTAMQLGYHRDPQTFRGMSPLHAEMRRRLWSTIMEMSVQAAFNSAMPPLISLDDFDTRPPLNINDDEISKSTETPPMPHPPTAYTQTTLQLHLHRSFPARLEAIHLSSSFRGDPSYDHVLRLGKEIMASCRFPFSSNASQATPFHLNHLDLLLRRPLLALHRSWVIKAKTDPRYYFSRKVTLDTALALTSNLPDDDWQRLLVVSPPLAGSAWLPILYIALEIIWQLEEEAPAAKSSSQAKLLRAPLIESLKCFTEFQLLRIKADDVNVKGLFFISAVVAQIEAMEKGESDGEVMNAIEEASVRSLRECLDILRAKVPAAAGEEGGQEVNGELNGAAAGGEYDFLQDMEDMGENDIWMGMDFEVNDMEMGAFGNLNEGSWL